MIDWSKPIIAVLRDERFPARVLSGAGRSAVQVEILGPHSIRPDLQLNDSTTWWFMADGSYCNSGRQGPFAHIENEESSA